MMRPGNGTGNGTTGEDYWFGGGWGGWGGWGGGGWGGWGWGKR